MHFNIISVTQSVKWLD